MVTVQSERKQETHQWLRVLSSSRAVVAGENRCLALHSGAAGKDRDRWQLSVICQHAICQPKHVCCGLVCAWDTDTLANRPPHLITKNPQWTSKKSEQRNISSPVTRPWREQKHVTEGPRVQIWGWLSFISHTRHNTCTWIKVSFRVCTVQNDLKL